MLGWIEDGFHVAPCQEEVFPVSGLVNKAGGWGWGAGQIVLLPLLFSQSSIALSYHTVSSLELSVNKKGSVAKGFRGSSPSFLVHGYIQTMDISPHHPRDTRHGCSPMAQGLSFFYGKIRVILTINNKNRRDSLGVNICQSLSTYNT